MAGGRITIAATSVHAATEAENAVPPSGNEHNRGSVSFNRAIPSSICVA